MRRHCLCQQPLDQSALSKARCAFSTLVRETELKCVSASSEIFHTEEATYVFSKLLLLRMLLSAASSASRAISKHVWKQRKKSPADAALFHRWSTVRWAQLFPWSLLFSFSYHAILPREVHSWLPLGSPHGLSEKPDVKGINPVSPLQEALWSLKAFQVSPAGCTYLLSSKLIWNLWRFCLDRTTSPARDGSSAFVVKLSGLDLKAHIIGSTSSP